MEPVILNQEIRKARYMPGRGMICECTELVCGRYQLETVLIVGGTIYVPKIVTRDPVDRSVTDPLTAWLNELQRHIYPAIEAARAAVRPYEHGSYPSYDACMSECDKKARPAAYTAFDRMLRETQDKENQGR
jgi:hypothetical protein